MLPSSGIKQGGPSLAAVSTVGYGGFLAGPPMMACWPKSPTFRR